MCIIAAGQLVVGLLGHSIPLAFMYIDMLEGTECFNEWVDLCVSLCFTENNLRHRLKMSTFWCVWSREQLGESWGQFKEERRANKIMHYEIGQH